MADGDGAAAHGALAAPWHCLPDLVLVKLLSYLDRRERLAAGLMCRRWLAALGAAPLWRSVRVVLQHRGGEERVAAAVLASPRLGPLVRRLDLRWARPSANTSPAATLCLLEALRAAGQAGHLQLHQLHLQDLVLCHKAQQSRRGHLLAALATFLGSQHQLQLLSLHNACLGVSEALRLLGAAARCSALADLRLHAAFREWQVPHASPRFSRLLRRLSPLSSLSVDYPAVSDATLRLLAECSPGLHKLAIGVRSTDYRQHSLSEDAWRDLASACPHLRVTFVIENLSHHEDLCGLLRSSVPLAVFRLYSGPVWDQSRSRDFRSTLRMLVAHYAQSLETVQLHLKNSREQLDDLLVDLLSRCGRLSTFHFDGVVRHLDTVRAICRLRLDAVIGFQAIHVRPKVVTPATRAAAKDITAAYQEALKEKTVDFRMEVPSVASGASQ